MVNKIVGLLAKFAPFVGIGIKTALGMEAVSSKIFFKVRSDSEQQQDF